jgi:hypothetical protein
MRNFLIRYPVLFSLFFFLISCGERESSLIDQTLEDPDLPVFTNTTPEYPDQPFDVREDLVIGVDTGEPDWQIFGSMVRLSVGKDGVMLIADHPSQSVYLVHHSGRLISRFGGRGSGPGEFQIIGRMWWIGDTDEFWISDPRLLRVSRFEGPGELIDTIRYGDEGKGFLSIMQLSGRDCLGIRSMPQSAPRLNYSLYGFLDEGLRWERDFKTLYIQRMLQETDRSWIAIPARIEGRPDLRSCPDGRIVISDPRNRWLTVYSKSGTPDVRFTRNWEEPALSRQETVRITQLLRSHIASTYEEDIEIPKSLPPFSTVVIDDESRIWVRRTRSSEAEEANDEFQFDIFSADGRWLATQPLTFVPDVIKAGFAYDTSSGSEDVGPRVIRYQLMRRNASDGKD